MIKIRLLPNDFRRIFLKGELVHPDILAKRKDENAVEVSISKCPRCGCGVYVFRFGNKPLYFCVYIIEIGEKTRHFLLPQGHASGGGMNRFDFVEHLRYIDEMQDE